ncbi:MAG: hypothetical protein GWN01_00225 [Nitrosopumilaceae archaeon]|nr:hypothetical protein [Nitrosopumilaceae archaeon]NIT99410.1 hypothetical protein [Nitrosopumilaceae archaeon]NIU86148.1 hypothetical protein [Nitrosopumilaceae archaeon]NIV64944.1 hypothetical protein [Nitrosopumilaceae archaeon]NIX60013.1 hypothetical protein [Nitrosopumilaceae archaeon]
MSEINSVLIFLVGLFISSVIIYLVTRLFGENRGIGTAILTAFVGTMVYAVSYHLIGTGWIAAIIGGIVWLIALGTLYKMGLIKSLITATGIWIIATIVGVLLPTTTGPL